MALRLIDIYLPPNADADGVRDTLSEHKTLGVWMHQLGDEGRHLRVFLEAENSETILDAIDSQCGNVEGYRVLLSSVEATLPRVEPPEEQDEQAEKANGEPTEEEKSPDRIAREELYEDVKNICVLNRNFMLMTLLSTVVAGVGMRNDNTAVVIGAMVIAPLLGPNVALSLATTLGDWPLGKTSLRTNLAGVMLAFVVSVMLGLFMDFDPAVDAIAQRTVPGFGDITLALASGCAAVIAVTSGYSSTLIGVMVAVALLPPLVACGMLLGGGHYEQSFGALLLLGANVISVNLSGVVTFLLQGIRPAKWWEADRARKATAFATVLWTLLLAGLAAILFFFHAAQE